MMDDVPRRLELLRKLSPRQIEILSLTCGDAPNSEIAERLVIALSTVEFHKKGIYTRLELGHLNKAARQRALGQFCAALPNLLTEDAITPDDPDPEEEAEKDGAVLSALVVAIREDDSQMEQRRRQRTENPTQGVDPWEPIEIPPTPPIIEQSRRRRFWPYFAVGVICLLAGAMAMLLVQGQLNGKRSDGGEGNREQPPTVVAPGQQSTEAAAAVTPFVSPGSPTPLGRVTQRPDTSATAVIAEADTPPGTVLEVGQTWRQNGLEVNLSKVDVSTKTVTMYFTLVNRRQFQTIFHFISGDTYSAVDNRERKLSLNELGVISDFTLNPNDNRPLYLEGTCCWPTFSEDLTDTSVSEITVTVTGISALTNARWMIRIHH